MKRIFTIIMMVCLLAGALSITAFAADGVVLTVSGLTKDGTPVKIEDYTSFEAGWNFAMEKAKDREYLDTNEYDRIVVDLLTDWNANAKGEFGDSDGVGFRQSTIHRFLTIGATCPLVGDFAGICYAVGEVNQIGKEVEVLGCEVNRSL